MDLSERTKIRLQVYSELVNKSEEEALYYALGIAKMFYKLQNKFYGIGDFKIIDTKSHYQLNLELQQRKRKERDNERAREYYKKNKIRLNELRKIRNQKKER